jgi:glycosyltransferase involved in cell wall biosynthesis
VTFAKPEIVFGLSVVIPLYQKARHVRTALEDAFRSCTLADAPFEIIVVDDGSTDGSGDVVRGWAAEAAGHAGALRLLTQENRGAAAARNAGWRAAQGPLILFLDADDRWADHHVREILSLARDFPGAALYADAWAEIGPDGTPRAHQFGIGSDRRGPLPCFFEAMSSGPMIVSSSTAAAPKSALERSGGFPEGVRHGEDKVGWGRLALLGEVVWSPRVGAIWDKSADNRSDGSSLPTPSPAFRDFLREAALAEGIGERTRRNIRTAIAVEGARLTGEIRIYDHDTPARYAERANPDPQPA